MKFDQVKSYNATVKITDVIRHCCQLSFQFSFIVNCSEPVLDRLAAFSFFSIYQNYS